MKTSELIGGLSWHVLVVLGAAMSSGCLIEDPPEFEEKQRTAPLLVLDLASHPTDQVNLITRPQPQVVELRVPVYSEDLGVPLYAELWRVGRPPENLISRGRAGPTSFDVRKELTLRWLVDELTPLGCNRLTLFVSHQSNLITGDQVPEFLDNRDVAVLTWWFYVTTRPGEEPKPGEEIASCDPIGAEPQGSL